MKKCVISFIFGCVFSSIIVSAALLYKADDVEFKPQDGDWQVTNVEDAINNIKYIEDHKCLKKESIGEMYTYAPNDNCLTGCSQTKTFDLSSREGYENFTIDNFYVELISLNLLDYGSSQFVSPRYLKDTVKQYDSDTGKLTVTVYGFGTTNFRSDVNVRIYFTYIDYCD